MNKRLFDLIQDFSNEFNLDYAFTRKRDEEIEIYVVAFKNEIIDEDSLYEDSMTMQVTIENGIVSKPVFHINIDVDLTLTFESLNKINEMMSELERVNQQ